MSHRQVIDGNSKACSVSSTSDPIVRFTDIDECEEYEYLCRGGFCVNFYGGYTCECETGYLYDENARECRGMYAFTMLT